MAARSRSPRRPSPPPARRSPPLRRVREYRRSRSNSPPSFRSSRRQRYSPPEYVRQVRRRGGDREDSEEKRKRAEKKSFLQEIVEKLREPIRQQMHEPQQQPQQPQMEYAQQFHDGKQMGMVAPTPVPAPMMVVPNMVANNYMNAGMAPYDPFDQSYFIGGKPQMPVSQVSYDGMQQMPQNMMPQNMMGQNLVPRNVIDPNIIPHPATPQPGNDIATSLQHKSELDGESQEEINKLFHDKKISLSEFLAITAKPEVNSTSPMWLKEKIKVIARCQEVLEMFSNNEKPFTGKLVLHRNRQGIDRKNLAEPTTLPFTSTTVESDMERFKKCVARLFAHGEDPAGVATPNPTPAIYQVTPPPPPLISVTQTKSCKESQTEQYKCQECERRSKISNKSIGTQYVHDMLTFSVSTQVSEDDLRPKSESLASLTPAQLLARPYNQTAAVKFAADEYERYKSSRSSGGFGGPGQKPQSKAAQNAYAGFARMHDEPNYLTNANNGPPGGGGGRGRGRHPPPAITDQRHLVNQLGPTRMNYF